MLWRSIPAPMHGPGALPDLRWIGKSLKDFEKPIDGIVILRYRVGYRFYRLPTAPEWIGLYQFPRRNYSNQYSRQLTSSLPSCFKYLFTVLLIYGLTVSIVELCAGVVTTTAGGRTSLTGDAYLGQLPPDPSGL
jgi:hypothetical protein